MSRMIKLNTVWLLPVLLLMLGTSVKGFPFSSDVVIGKIVPLEGLVVVKRKSKGITVKPPAMIIYRGDNVLTNATGKARILLTGGNEVYVGPSSTLYLNKNFQSRYNYEYNLNLKGKLRAKIQRVKGRRFRIKTSTAVIDVKGTDFIINSSAATTQVATFTGLVQLTSLKTKKVVDIPPGKMSSVTDVGKIAKLKKVQIEIVKDLEETGKTGIKELDTIMKPPPPLDPTINMEIEADPPQKLPPEPVVLAKLPEKSEPEPIAEPEEPPSIWTYAEEYRMKNRLGFGFAGSVGDYVGGFLFVEYNLGPRSQLHYQSGTATHEESRFESSTAETFLQRNLSALTYRHFLTESGIYFGAGFGSSQFEQQFSGGMGSFEITANGSFVIAELGAQAYGQSLNNTFYVSIGTQRIAYTSFEADFISGSISEDEHDDFTQRAQSGIEVFHLGFGWFF